MCFQVKRFYSNKLCFTVLLVSKATQSWRFSANRPFFMGKWHTHTHAHVRAHTHTHTKVFLISVYSAVGSKLPALAKKAQHESEVLKKRDFFLQSADRWCSVEVLWWPTFQRWSMKKILHFGHRRRDPTQWLSSGGERASWVSQTQLRPCAENRSVRNKQEKNIFAEPNSI